MAKLIPTEKGYVTPDDRFIVERFKVRHGGSQFHVVDTTDERPFKTSRFDRGRNAKTFDALSDLRASLDVIYAEGEETWE